MTTMKTLKTRMEEQEQREKEAALKMSFLQLLNSPMFNVPEIRNHVFAREMFDYYVDNYDPERTHIGLRCDALHYVIEDLLNKAPSILILIVSRLHYYEFDGSCYSIRDVAHRALCNWFWDKKESPFFDIHLQVDAMVAEWKRNRE